MKPRIVLAETQTVTNQALELIEHDGRYHLECLGAQVAALHLGHPASELVNMLSRPFRPARKPRLIFLGLGFGHALRAAWKSLPQEKAEFVILPEAEGLPDLLTKHLPENLLDDDRLTIEDESPFRPIPSHLSGSQAIIADVDHLQAMAPKTWSLNKMQILHNFYDTLKAGGLVGLLMNRADPELEKSMRKCGFEVVKELAPLSEKSKKNRLLHLARKGHYQTHR